MGISEQDWRMFKKYIPMWQERYMESLLLEYRKIIEENKNPSTRFWELHDKINLDKKKTGIQLILNKKDVEYHLLMLLKEKAITINDLDVFSNEWKEYIISCYRIWIDSISISLSESK